MVAIPTAYSESRLIKLEEGVALESRSTVISIKSPSIKSAAFAWGRDSNTGGVVSIVKLLESGVGSSSPPVTLVFT